MRTTVLAAVLAAFAMPCLAADITHSSDGFTYFNRPGATLAEHDSDVLECRQLAGRLHQPLPPQPASGYYVAPGESEVGAAIGTAIGQLIVLEIQQKTADHKAGPALVENCMVVKGWRVVALPSDEGAALVALDKKAKAAKLGEYVGASEPHGVVLRTFGNEAASGASAGFFVAAAKKGTAISADATARTASALPGGNHPYSVPSTSTPRPSRPSGAKPPQPLTDSELGGVPTGRGLIVVNVGGDKEIAIVLERVGGDPNAPAWMDGKPSEIVVTRPATTFAKSGAGAGATYVYAAPPGTWRVASATVDWVALNFCLGSPAFQLKEGEVIYAGSFAPNRLIPDMDIAPAKAVFPGLSTATDKLQPASWVNGAQGQCSGSDIYALEAPGRPYLPGYTFGGHAGASPPQLAPELPQLAAAMPGTVATMPAATPSPPGNANASTAPSATPAAAGAAPPTAGAATPPVTATMPSPPPGPVAAKGS
jgi:hypothetical protein